METLQLIGGKDDLSSVCEFVERLYTPSGGSLGNDLLFGIVSLRRVLALKEQTHDCTI